ncbi:MAG: S8 family serine peptidase [Thermoleophilia bacterium]|nr:S8 family serine peptidase [Thermoleophilia bacterium]
MSNPVKTKVPAPYSAGGAILLVVLFVAALVACSGGSGATAAVDYPGRLIGDTELVAGGNAQVGDVECQGLIAIKLASGTRLHTAPDGNLVVVGPDGPIPDVTPASEKLAPKVRLRVKAVLADTGIYILEPCGDGASVGTGSELRAALEVLQSMPGVEWAELNSPLEACLVPNDPYYLPGGLTSIGQWYLRRTGYPSAWDITTGSKEVVLAVLDTGLNTAVPDFAGRVVSPYSMIDESSAWPSWRDNRGHGTAVAGVAVAQGNNLQGIAGAAWNVGIMPVKISDQGESDTITLARAMQYAVDNGADVINISFASPPTEAKDPPKTLVAAVQYASDRGVLVVAAAGNDGAQAVAYPAALPSVIAVGATDLTDGLLADADAASNTGDNLDVVAPGKSILTYDGQSSTSVGYFKGTSLAAPLVSGLAALMLSANTRLSARDVGQLLTAAADDLGAPGWDKAFGWGIIDAAEAVQEATRFQGSTTTTTAGASRFKDVSAATTPYWLEIEHLASLGVVSGSAGLFRPNDPLLRQQFAKMIVLAVGFPVSTQDLCPFSDVPLSQGEELYPDHYIAVAYARGLVRGVDLTHFAPYRTLTRAQLVTMVVRAAGLVSPPPEYQCRLVPSQFPSMEHYENACKAAYAGILGRLVGVDASYNFGAPASRGEACALLYALIR